MNFTAQLSRILEPIRTKIRVFAQRAIISLIDDSKSIQLIQVEILQGEIKSKVERIQNYGFTGVPPLGGEAVILNFGGNRENAIVLIADNSKYRKKGLQSGEVALYDKNGSYILLRTNGDVVIKPSGKVLLGADTLAATAGVVTGECLCAFTGAPHPDKSSVILAKKVP